MAPMGGSTLLFEGAHLINAIRKTGKSCDYGPFLAKSSNVPPLTFDLNVSPHTFDAVHKFHLQQQKKLKWQSFPRSKSKERGLKNYEKGRKIMKRKKTKNNKNSNDSCTFVVN